MNDWRSYDLVAEAYHRIHAPRTRLPAADLVAMAAPPAGGRVLDIGTGTGVAAAVAKDEMEGGLVVGIDPSLAMLLAGRNSHQAVSLAVAEAIDLPFRAAAFDVVLANFVLSHFTKYETALFDMIRVLKPGGRMAVSTWAEGLDEFQRTWHELVAGAVSRELLSDALNRSMPWEDRFSVPDRLEQTLRDAGLRPVRVEQRKYRFPMTREDYVAGRETSATGRFLREMLGDRGWEPFRAHARSVFAERFPDPLIDFRDVLLAVGTKPS